MKQTILKCMVVMAIFFAASQQSFAQRIYVNIRPKAVVVERPAAPAPNYIWVEGEWVPQGRSYVYRQGYWVAPRARRIWVPGHWVGTRRGEYWVRGYWRRG